MSGTSANLPGKKVKEKKSTKNKKVQSSSVGSILGYPDDSSEKLTEDSLNTSAQDQNQKVTKLERRKILVSHFLRDRNLTYDELGKLAGVTKSSAYRIIEKLKRDGTVAHKTGPRKSKVNLEQARKIIADHKEFPNMSRRELAEKNGSSKTTVCKILKKQQALKIQIKKNDKIKENPKNEDTKESPGNSSKKIETLPNATKDTKIPTAQDPNQKLTSLEKRKIVVAHFIKDRTLSYAELGRLAGVKRSTAFKIIAKLKRDGTVAHKTGPRKKRFAANLDKARSILEDHQKFPKMSHRELAKKHETPKSTVGHILRKKTAIKQHLATLEKNPTEDEIPATATQPIHLEPTKPEYYKAEYINQPWQNIPHAVQTKTEKYENNDLSPSEYLITFL